MRAAVIGTGMMGPGIAMTLTLGGVEAVILGRTEESAAKGLDTARRQLALLAANDLVSAEQRRLPGSICARPRRSTRRWAGRIW
jgi:3-hydroxyacyl-CoA dehydrogenase